VNDDLEVSRSGLLDEDSVVIDLDRTLSMPASLPNVRSPASGSRLGGAVEVDGSRSVNAEEIDGPSDGSSWFQPQSSPARMAPDQRWTASCPESSPPELLPFHNEGTSVSDGPQRNEVAGAAAIAAVLTFFQELAGLSGSLVAQLSISQRWRDVLPAICAVTIGLLCRFASVDHLDLNETDDTAAPATDLGV